MGSGLPGFLIIVLVAWGSIVLYRRRQKRRESQRKRREMRRANSPHVALVEVPVSDEHPLLGLDLDNSVKPELEVTDIDKKMNEAVEDLRPQWKTQ